MAGIDRRSCAVLGVQEPAAPARWLLTEQARQPRRTFAAGAQSFHLRSSAGPAPSGLAGLRLDGARAIPGSRLALGHQAESLGAVPDDHFGWRRLGPASAGIRGFLVEPLADAACRSRASRGAATPELRPARSPSSR